MKYNYSNFLYLFIATILFSCTPKQTTDKKSDDSSHPYTTSYKAPVFENDNRIEKIQKLAPELQQLIEAHAKKNNIPGIAYGIVVDNQLVIASSTGYINLEKKTPATPLSDFRIASMTKSFTAMAIMKLKDDGKLALSDPASKYIPEMAKLKYLTKDASIITIENLLTMTAGFPEDNPWGDRQLNESTKMLLDLIANDVSFSNPTSHGYEYSNTGYALLGNIVSRVSGMPFQEFIKKTIFDPLGMKNTYWEIDNVPKEKLVLGYRWEDKQWKLEPMLHDGAYGAMGGLITTIEDFSKYVSFHLSAWPSRNYDETGPIKRSSLREMQTAQFSRLSAKATDANGNPCPIMYGYGFGLSTATYCNGLKQVGHGGALPGFGSDYRFYPEYGVGIMAFCNLTYTSAYPSATIRELLFDKLDLQPRKLPASAILIQRQKQIVELIQHWNPALEKAILAENFYLDKARKVRISETETVLKKAGAIKNTTVIEPLNQLRGSFNIHTANGVIRIFFTLTPEKSPKIQRLNLSFQPNKTR